MKNHNSEHEAKTEIFPCYNQSRENAKFTQQKIFEIDLHPQDINDK